MIKNNQKSFNRIHIIIDGILLILSYIISYNLRFNSFLKNSWLFNLDPTSNYYDLVRYMQVLIYLIPGYLVIYYYCDLYSPKRIQSTRVGIENIIKANFFGILYFTTILFITKDIHISRHMIFIFFIVNIISGSLFRLVLSYALRKMRKKGYNLKHVIVVGYSNAAKAYIDRIIANPQWGYYIHGILDDTMVRGTAYKNVKVLGDIDNLLEILPQNKLDEIVITLSIDEYSKLEQLVKLCEKSGVHTKFIPDYQSFFPSEPYMEDLNGLPVINIRNVPLSNSWNKFLKRCVDVFGALVALTLFSIPMIIVALIIKTTSSGPIIFSQIRIGSHNKEFQMYKFRSMEVQTSSKEKSAWTTFNDPRVTKIGKFIRKTSIDELPQLFNVLKGDMSLIGPRPERPFFVDKFKEEIPRYMIKHQVKPGLTGWAQISGYRGDTSIRKRIEYDLYYIENWTLIFDFKILFFTFFKGFINKNAY